MQIKILVEIIAAFKTIDIELSHIITNSLEVTDQFGIILLLLYHVISS